MIFKRTPVIAVLLTALLTIVMAMVLSCPPKASASESHKLLPVKYLSLKESLLMAKETSITLAMEEKKLKAAKLNAKNVDLRWLPDLLIGASYKYEDKEDYEFGEIVPFVTLSQVAFNDRASYTKKLSAMNKLVNAKIQRQTNLNELYSKTIKKYFSLLTAQDQAQLENYFFKQYEVILKTAESHAKDGLISKIELMQNESMLELAKIEKEAGENKVEYAEFELSSLLNQEKKATIRASHAITPVFYPISFDSCRQYAQKHHPILQLNNQILKKLPEYRRMAKLTRWPSISLSAYVGTGAMQWDNENRYGVTLTATQSLFDFGKTKRRLEILDLELETIENSINNSKTHFFSGLRMLHKEFLSSADTVQSLEKLNMISGKLSKAIKKNYQLGLISHKELLKSRKKEIKTKKKYKAAVARYLVAEMVLKINSGVSDIDIILQQGPGWLESPSMNITNSKENPSGEYK